MPLKFAYLCQLFQQLEALESKTQDVPVFAEDKRARHVAIIEKWFRDHRKILDAPSTNRIALLSSLLPERRTDRVYWLQPKGLLNVLCRCLGYGNARLQRLRSWDPSSETDLVSWVVAIVKPTDAGMPLSHLDVEDVDNVLDRVAARCRFSSTQIRQQFKDTTADPVHLFLGPLIHRMPSHELKWFLRLVLKSFHTFTLDESLILSQVHFLLPKLFMFQSNILAADSLWRNSPLRNLPAQLSAAKKDLLMKNLPKGLLKPRVGVKISSPAFVKARSFEHCIKLASRRRWVVQRKYDGEYCQIHINLERGHERIQIFSKSGKDATLDRAAVHGWVERCLRLDTDHCVFKNVCILEGELLVYDCQRKTIAPFHKIRKHVTRSGHYIGTEKDSPAHSHEQLIILFYDILLMDEHVLLEQPYNVRKRRLRESITYFDDVVDEIHRINDVELGVLDLRNVSQRKTMLDLQGYFAREMSRQGEGIVLKPYDEPYFSLKASERFHGFIKLKRDVIPGLGDTADLVVVGVRRDTSKPYHETARWNCFLIACLENKSEVLRFQDRPMFKLLDVVHRPCISKKDIGYLSSVGSLGNLSFQQLQQSQSYNVQASELIISTDMFLLEPIIVECLGSGFDKPSSCDFYMLRFPRIRKIHFDRGYEDVISFEELQQMGMNASEQNPELAKEEDLWRHRIQQQARSSAYMIKESPFSQRDTSPSSDSSTSNQAEDRTILISQAADYELSASKNEHVTEVVEESMTTSIFRKWDMNNRTRKRHYMDSAVDESLTKRGRPLEEVSNVSFQRNGSDRASLPDATHPIKSHSANLVQCNAAATKQSRADKASKCEQSLSESNHDLRGSTAHPYRPGYHFLQEKLPLFVFSTVYVSRCLRGTPYMVEDLLPNLSPANTTTNLSHWERELLNSGQFGAVVGESQAFSGLQKVVLVESRRTQQTAETITRIRGLRLVSGEKVEIWDWRMMEELHVIAGSRLSDIQWRGQDVSAIRKTTNYEQIKLNCSSTLSRASERNPIIKRLADNYLGKVAASVRMEGNEWFPANDERKRRAARKVMEQAFG